jgi:hypothetical protein
MGMIAHPAEDSRMPSKTPHSKTLRLKSIPHYIQFDVAKIRSGVNEAAGNGQNKETLSQPRIRGCCCSAATGSRSRDHDLGRGVPNLHRVDA